jgi:phage shock protein A
MKDKIKRLEKREASLVSRGRKAVDEGRERKADRLLGRAARVENRLIKTKAKRAASKKK